GGNLTGVNFLQQELVAKRLALLRELVPAATRVAVLVNPASASGTQATLQDTEAAASTLGIEIQPQKASTPAEIDVIFAAIDRTRTDGLFVGGDPFFPARRVQLANLAAHRSIPTTFGSREYAEAGGLMSYGASLNEAYRQAGAYAGRILKGA